MNDGNVWCFDGQDVRECRRLWRLKYPVPDHTKPYDRRLTRVAWTSDSPCDACNVDLCQSPDQEIEQIISHDRQFSMEIVGSCVAATF